MDKEKEDRISSLPDCLLLEIISRLDVTTKQVIKATTTISKRWQHLWTKLPTLVFIYEDDVSNLCYNTDLSDYLSFIDKTLTQCPTDVNLNKFKLIIIRKNLNKFKHIIRTNSEVYTPTKSQVYSWIRHAITRNVQEVNLLIHAYVRSEKKIRYDDELFFNNSCLRSMKLSCCVLTPPNGAIRWDKLKCLCIDDGTLDEDLIEKILCGSPCLETLEFVDCSIEGGFSKSLSLFGNLGVERLSCGVKTYEWFTSGDELFQAKLVYIRSMKFSRCVFNPPNGWGNLNFLSLHYDKLNEDLIGKVLSGSPCLETLQLIDSCGFRRIDVTSKSVKNLMLIGYRYTRLDCYTNTIEINAPHMLSLTIKGELYLDKILLENVSSLVEAELNYMASNCLVQDRRRDRKDIEEELLRGLLSSLGHVKEIALGENTCLRALDRLEDKGFKFREGRRGIYPSATNIFH